MRRDRDTCRWWKRRFGGVFIRDGAENERPKADPKDDYLSLLGATIKCSTVPEKYFEKLLRLSINKMGTDEWGTYRSCHYSCRGGYAAYWRRVVLQKQCSS
ncbi:hypothetical protein Ancab_026328 [Ancistrocladus abbreviatus]